MFNFFFIPSSQEGTTSLWSSRGSEATVVIQRLPRSLRELAMTGVVKHRPAMTEKMFQV